MILAMKKEDSTIDIRDVDSDELDEFKVKTNSDYEEEKTSRESSEVR